MTPNVLYLNHAGTSWPKPDAVSEAVREAMSVNPGHWPLRFDEAHQAIADYFGVERREQVLLTPGCTSALSVGISDAFIPSGKRVLTSQWEHHALHRPLLKLALSGVRVEYIPPERSPRNSGNPLDLDWLEDALSEKDVALVAITAACNVTGELLPYQEVVRLVHKYDSMVLIDAAQIVGWLELDLPRLGADMVAFGGHKGLQGPWGIGGLYVAERALMECISATCGLPTGNMAGQKKSPRPGYCDVGSVDQFALAGLHAAVEILRQENAESRLNDARKQILRLREALRPLEGIRFLTPAETGRTMPTLALEVSGSSSGEVAASFQRHGLLVGSGLHCAPLAHQTLGTETAGLVRLSVGLGQPDEQIDEAIERLESALSELSHC